MTDIKTSCTPFDFHSDIVNYLYFADSPLKNYEYSDPLKDLNIQVVVGNHESGIDLLCDEEPSAIYFSYNIIENPEKAKTKISSHPRYRALNPYQRFEYLTFLCNPYEKTNISYVYLLFYALERRLSEGQEQVIPIIQKLADCHGGKFKQDAEQTLYRYQLWKAGQRFPTNARVFKNYTLRVGCYDDKL